MSESRSDRVDQAMQLLRTEARSLDAQYRHGLPTRRYNVERVILNQVLAILDGLYPKSATSTEDALESRGMWPFDDDEDEPPRYDGEWERPTFDTFEFDYCGSMP